MPAGMALHQAFPSSSSSSLSSASTATEPPRTYSLPTVEILQAASSTLDSAEDWDQVSWAQDVLRLVERQVNPSGAGGGGGGPTDFAHPDSSRPTTQHLPPALKELLEMAVPILIVVSTSPDTRAAALACYLKARLQASGLCDDMLPKNQRQAFKDFEAAARGGEVRGWFRLGRDYEGVNDLQRAKDCYERGMKRGDCECTYRMGMAYLLGQLNMPTNPGTALTLLRQACDISTIDFPQPSYVYGMLLAGELSVPTEIKSHLVLPPTSVPNEALYAQWTIARDAIERAAYFCYPPAQYKAGHLYEHAALGCAYDPLVSVNWYTYASKNGETEADMALSKWFLCGAEGHFPKNENLARTFAEKAARKGHPNGCFALGYYYELGVGGRKDLDQARKWYQKAANLGNTDAPARLSALSAPVPTSISMAWHESRLNDTLVRRRTQAKIRSDRTSVSRPSRRPAQPQAQPPQLPIPMPMSPMAQLNNINNNSCTNNQVYKSPRPDIRGDHPLPTPTSPAPRVGEIMSPNPNSGYVAGGGAGRGGGGGYHMPSSNSFPSRPPIPHQAFQASASTSAHSPISPESQMFPRRQSAHTPIQDQNQNPHNQGRVGEDGRRYNGPGSTASNATISGVSTSTSLSNLPLPERRNDGKQPRKEAQTFAEMGFVSKPVEEEGCVIM
ncbi:hypothetical protein I317_06054 [Kwoniella heveanensis CBS 569]|nr:hypothetical protein I317_06054 [Kwoniella heveanensis CBS 569]